MIAALLDAPAVQVGMPVQADRAIGVDAVLIRHLLQGVKTAPESITLGQRRQQGIDALKQAYAEARQSGWDGYNALPVDPGTYPYACSFIEALPSSIELPEIAAEPDGEIALDWDHGPGRTFSVSIGRNGRLTYAGIFGQLRRYGTEFLVGSIPPVIADTLTRYFTSGSGRAGRCTSGRSGEGPC